MAIWCYCPLGVLAAWAVAVSAPHGLTAGAETKIKPRQPGEMTWNEYKAQMERDEAVKAKMTKHGWFSQEAIAARKEQRAVLRALKAAAKNMVKL